MQDMYVILLILVYVCIYSSNHYSGNIILTIFSDD